MTYDINNIKAILFDMDGTLVDSESLTELALCAMLHERDISTNLLDLVQFHGITWKAIGQRLAELYPPLAGEHVQLATEIEARFQSLFETTPPELIPGARAAFIAAADTFPETTTIVTGSESRAVELLLDRADLRTCCVGYTSCEHYSRSKPDPQSYLMAAQRLGVAADGCLVFEDSRPGLLAARAAGMSCVAITRGVPERRLQAEQLADAAIDDWHDLSATFFSDAV